MLVSVSSPLPSLTHCNTRPQELPMAACAPCQTVPPYHPSPQEGTTPSSPLMPAGAGPRTPLTHPGYPAAGTRAPWVTGAGISSGSQTRTASRQVKSIDNGKEPSVVSVLLECPQSTASSIRGCATHRAKRWLVRVDGGGRRQQATPEVLRGSSPDLLPEVPALGQRGHEAPACPSSPVRRTSPFPSLESLGHRRGLALDSACPRKRLTTYQVS